MRRAATILPMIFPGSSWVTWLAVYLRLPSRIGVPSNRAAMSCLSDLISERFMGSQAELRSSPRSLPDLAHRIMYECGKTAGSALAEFCSSLALRINDA